MNRYALPLGLPVWLLLSPLCLGDPTWEPRGPGQVVEAYVAAALDGRTDDAAKLANPDTVPARRASVETMSRVLKQDSLPLSSVYVSEHEGRALVVSRPVQLAEAQPDRQSTGRLTFLLRQFGEQWLIEDIDLESEDGANREIEQFQERFPDANQVDPLAAADAALHAAAYQVDVAHPQLNRPATPLEFCILPNPPADGREPVLAQELFESLKETLSSVAERSGQQPDDRFRWCEVDSSVDELLFTAEHQGRTYAVVSAEPSRVLRWGPGWQLREIESTVAPGRPEIRTLGIDLDNAAAARMRELTRANLHNRMAIIVAGKIVSAPIIRAEIGSRAQITGSFSDEEWEQLKKVLFQAAQAWPQPASDGQHGPAASTEDTIEALQRRYFQCEHEAAMLAETIRRVNATSPSDDQQLEQKSAELRTAVERAFATRQQLQQAKVAELRGRLERIERQISIREQARQQIIDRRIEELTNPGLQDPSTLTLPKK